MHNEFCKFLFGAKTAPGEFDLRLARKKSDTAIVDPLPDQMVQCDIV